ncbi:Response regulator receiver domain-containing protein [Sanguibacter gelidistatuariae]|uniref:Response regulator receiver domain-containing protein n=2 Tax=Sanguibacter gelidistatuariae TaxID=1814289 RepID=A0A1G6QHW8_9MICO|nr:Response regulator receiver domain-containing protein [Sanguibacter gelidistatuariae]
MAGSALGGSHPSAQGPAVVVIEDDADIRALIHSVLVRGGLQVHIARCGLEGLALVATVRPALVTLDVGLPDIDGYEVLRRLRADPRNGDLPVLLLSARSQEEELTETCAFLAKPFRARELRATVAGLIAAQPSPPAA